MHRLFRGFIHVLTLSSSIAIFRRVISENIPQLLKEIPYISEDVVRTSGPKRNRHAFCASVSAEKNGTIGNYIFV